MRPEDLTDGHLTPKFAGGRVFLFQGFAELLVGVGEAVVDPANALVGGLEDRVMPEQAAEAGDNRHPDGCRQCGRRRMAACPLPAPCPDRRRAGLDRAPVQIGLQVSGERECRRVTMLGAFREALQADGFEVTRYAGPKLVWRDRLFGDHITQDFEIALAQEGGPAGQDFIEDRAQAVDVGLGADLVLSPLCLFGCHVRR